MKKVSFDFDDTLEFKDIQNYAKELVDKGIEIHIVTTRYEDISNYPNNRDGHLNHDYLFKVAEELNISKNNIHFTNMIDKTQFFKENTDFIWHIDDDNIQCTMITRSTKTKGIAWLYGDWKSKCNRLLNIT